MKNKIILTVIGFTLSNVVNAINIGSMSDQEKADASEKIGKPIKDVNLDNISDQDKKRSLFKAGAQSFIFGRK